MTPELDLTPPEVPEPTFLEIVLRYGLFLGAIFQLVCILAVIIPSSKVHNQVRGSHFPYIHFCHMTISVIWLQIQFWVAYCSFKWGKCYLNPKYRRTLNTVTHKAQNRARKLKDLFLSPDRNQRKRARKKDEWLSKIKILSIVLGGGHWEQLSVEKQWKSYNSMNQKALNFVQIKPVKNWR